MFTNKKFDVFLNKDMQVCIGSFNLINPEASTIVCRTIQSMTAGAFTNLSIQFNTQSIVIYFNGVAQDLIGNTTNLYSITGRAKLNIGQVNPSLFALQFDSALSNQIDILDQLGAYGTPRILPKSFYSEKILLAVEGLPAQFIFDNNTGYIINNQFRNLSQEEFSTNFTVTATLNSEIVQSRSYFIRIIPSLLLLENSKAQNDNGTRVYSYKWAAEFTGVQGELFWSGSTLTIADVSLNSLAFIPPTQTLAKQTATIFTVFHANGQVIFDTGITANIWVATTNSITSVTGGYRYNNASMVPFEDSTLPTIDETVFVKTYNKYDITNTFISDDASIINLDILFKSYHLSKNIQTVLTGATGKYVNDVVPGQAEGIQRSNFATVNYANISLGNDYSLSVVDSSTSVNYGIVNYKKAAATIDNPIGQTSYTSPGTYTFVAPVGVFSVHVLAVGSGSGGGWSVPCWSGQSAGGGGGLAWKNGITVVPGSSYLVQVGGWPSPTSPDSFFSSPLTMVAYGANQSNGQGGSFFGEGGGAGGNGGNASGCWQGNGGGGAGGYTGNGGNGYSSFGVDAVAGGGGGGGGGGAGSGGGGVGLLGQGADGPAANGFNAPSPNIGRGGGGGSGGQGAPSAQICTSPCGDATPAGQTDGGFYGGGGGGYGFNQSWGGGRPATGAVRIIWGATRSWPSTGTGDIGVV